MNEITIAIPKGRLYEGVREFLVERGIKIMPFEETNRQYFFKDYFGKGINLFIAKPKAIPQLLESGMCQFGFCGKDIMEDSNVGLDSSELLCHTHKNIVNMVYAVNPKINQENLNRPIICATEFPNIAAKYLVGNKGLATYILNTTGATEGYVHIGADCIIDVCETGATILANGLSIRDILFATCTCFYGVKGISMPEIVKQILK